MRIGNSINTFTGVKFYPLDPRVDEIRTEDIGHALSLMCRANGHSSHFFSVAQHSLNCAKEAKERKYSIRVQLACLLHDASEAYISDIIRPVKKELMSYLAIEEKLQKAIYRAYGLSDLTVAELQLIKEIDDAMLSYEMKQLLNTRIESDTKLASEYDLSFRPMHTVKNSFIKYVKVLHVLNRVKSQ